MEYPSNSDKQRPKTTAEPVEKVQRVTRSAAVQRKKPLGKRFSETFMGGDARNAGSFVVFDVLLPALRDMVADTVTMGIERMVYGDTRPRGRGGMRTPGLAGHTAYNRVAAGLRPDPRESIPANRRARGLAQLDDIIIDTRVEAEEVIDHLFNLVQKYDQATVANLYDLVGITSAYTDNKWGWTDLSGTDIRRVREGYLLKLPHPEAL